jgi:hypothetical protein
MQTRTEDIGNTVDDGSFRRNIGCEFRGGVAGMRDMRSLLWDVDADEW